MPRRPTVASPKPDPNAAMQAALAELLVVMTPDVAGKIAIGCLRLAAAAVAIGEANKQGPRVGASELLLLLAEGAPKLPDQLGAV